MEEMKKMISTMSGMWALWDFEQYKNINSYDDWEDLFVMDETIMKQIDISKIVPIYYHTDGSYLFEVKINDSLNEREKKYAFKKSQRYLFNSSGIAVVSGIECIGGSVRDDECIKFSLEKGLYSVEINLIAWDSEPGMKLDTGFAATGALPDIIVCINKENDSNGTYRKSVETFDL